MKTALKIGIAGLAVSTLGLIFFIGFQKKSAGDGVGIGHNDSLNRFYSKIKSLADFNDLKGLPLSHKFSEVGSVKVIYEVSTGRLYFVNSNFYRLHFTFCKEVLDCDQSLLEFNALNYSGLSYKNYYLATLNYYSGIRRFALEFSSSTKYKASEFSSFIKAVKHSFYIKDSLSLLVNSDHLMAMESELEQTIHRLYPQDIYLHQRFQALNTGICYGILKKIEDNDEAYSNVSANDIIIIRGTPIQIPKCKGLITNTFQSPLSHVNLLCHSRNIPSACQTDIWEQSALNALMGKPVKLSIGVNGLKIEKADPEEITEQQVTKKKALTFNITEKGLISGAKLNFQQSASVGHKAANLGELALAAQLSGAGFECPKGMFAIPFYHYYMHLRSPEIKTVLEALYVANPQNREEIDIKLKHLRKAIKDKTIDPKLLTKVNDQLAKHKNGNSYRFRSSSNAEDADQFNGAGLYKSKTGIVGDDKKSIEKAIKAVWASAWTSMAYWERELAGMDHSTMMMGVLVHVNFPDELTNGVAITKNLYRRNFPGHTISVQLGEMSVVTPPEGVVSEQVLCTPSDFLNPFSNDLNIEYISLSSLSGHKPILTKAQWVQLCKSLEAVKQHFFIKKVAWTGNKSFDEYALDIEFKFLKNGKLIFKQVRPY